VETFAPEFGPGVGLLNLNAWLVGFSGPQATLHRAGVRFTPLGWPHQLVLVAGADVTQPITHSGQVVTIGLGKVWFSLGDEGQATTSLTLDPQVIFPPDRRMADVGATDICLQGRVLPLEDHLWGDHNGQLLRRWSVARGG
jgi:hypothetical protein